MDFYSILDIDSDASAVAVRAAYRRAAVKYHPDKNIENHKDAEIRFKAALEAYETLVDPARRKTYDATRPARTRPVHSMGPSSHNGYDVEADERGISVHTMEVFQLANIDDAFSSCAFNEIESGAVRNTSQR